MNINATLTELCAEIADTVLENMYYANVTAPETLYTHDKVHDCCQYTDEAQDRFNTLHDMIEQTIGSYLLNKDLEL
jgi:hypothetical protein